MSHVSHLVRSRRTLYLAIKKEPLLQWLTFCKVPSFGDDGKKVYSDLNAMYEYKERWSQYQKYQLIELAIVASCIPVMFSIMYLVNKFNQHLGTSTIHINSFMAGFIGLCVSGYCAFRLNLFLSEAVEYWLLNSWRTCEFVNIVLRVAILDSSCEKTPNPIPLWMRQNGAEAQDPLRVPSHVKQRCLDHLENEIRKALEHEDHGRMTAYTIIKADVRGFYNDCRYLRIIGGSEEESLTRFYARVKMNIEDEGKQR